MRNSTLLFLVKKESDTVTDICLAMKKRGFGKDRYNGYGGKVEEGETIVDAVKRELVEESGVITEELEKYGEIEFTFPHRPDFNQYVHVYLSTSWIGEPEETEEMSPLWYAVENIPYDQMWPDDIFWLPKVIEENKKIRAKFSFGEGDVIQEQEVVVVDSL